jgi:hypothetical protein
MYIRIFGEVGAIVVARSEWQRISLDCVFRRQCVDASPVPIIARITIEIMLSSPKRLHMLHRRFVFVLQLTTQSIRSYPVLTPSPPSSLPKDFANTPG